MEQELETMEQELETISHISNPNKILRYTNGVASICRFGQLRLALQLGKI